MSDLITRLADAIEPSVFLPYMLEKSAQLSAFVSSGIVMRDGVMDELCAKAGGTKSGGNITMPFWADLSGAASIISAVGTATDATKLDGTAKDIAVKQGREKKFGVGDLVGRLVDTSDLFTIIGDRVGAYWSREDQDMLIATLAGVFAAASMSGSVSNIFSESAATVASNTDQYTLNGSTIIDACQLLGDAKGKLTGMAMHSAVESWLNKQDLIDYIPDSEGKPTIPFYQGKRVIVDDSLPSRAGTTSGTVYTTYLFGPGALAYGEEDLSKLDLEAGFGSYGVERERSASAGNTFIYFRRIFLMHPRGVKWVGTATGEWPTNTELAVGTNWTRVYQKKNIRMVAVVHNVG